MRLHADLHIKPFDVRILIVLFAFLVSACTSTNLQNIVSSTASSHETLTINAVYKPFEKGFMVYVEGQLCLYAYADDIVIPRTINAQEFGAYKYCLPFADAPETAPADPFDHILLLYNEIADILGAPTGEAIRYETSFPPSDRVVMGGVFYEGKLTLPDGKKLYCGARAATAGTCQLR